MPRANRRLSNRINRWRLMFQRHSLKIWCDWSLSRITEIHNRKLLKNLLNHHLPLLLLLFPSKTSSLHAHPRNLCKFLISKIHILLWRRIQKQMYWKVQLWRRLIRNEKVLKLSTWRTNLKMVQTDKFMRRRGSNLLIHLGLSKLISALIRLVSIQRVI